MGKGKKSTRFAMIANCFNPVREWLFKWLPAFLFPALAIEIELEPLCLSSRGFALCIETSEVAILILLTMPFLKTGSFFEFLKRNRTTVIFACLFIASAAASVWFSDLPKSYTIKWLVRYMVVIGACLTLFFLFFDHEESGWVFLKTIAVIAVFSAAVAILEANSESLNLWLSSIFRQGELARVGPKIRPGATLGHPNILGCFLSATVYVFFYLRQRRIIGLRSFLPALALLCIGVALSGSRNALLSYFIPAFLFFGNKNYRKNIAVFIVFSVVCILAFSPSVSRITNTLKLEKDHSATRPSKPRENDNETRTFKFQENDSATRPSKPKENDNETRTFKFQENGSATRPSKPKENDNETRTFKFQENGSATRLMIWKSALEMFLERPILGTGPGGCNKKMKDYAPRRLLALERHKIEKEYLNAHNGPLNLLAEFGIAGTSFFLLFVISIIRRIFEKSGVLPVGPVHAIIFSLGMSFFPDAFFYDYFYMIFVFSVLGFFASRTGLEDRSSEKAAPLVL